MTSVDELFKKPGFPNNKRKLEASRNPDEIYKAAKLSAKEGANGSRHQSHVEDEDEEDIAGPELPLEETEEVPDDEEGRFFGGGVSKDTEEVLEYLDEREKEDVVEETIDAAWLRRLALNFERKISKNAELRSKFEDDPQKFMASEADLDADVKALSILTDHPELYAEFAKLGCVNSLVSLLAHENTDIAIDAIEIISEMTDEDVQAEQAQWDVLVDALFEADLLNLLVENLARLNETNETDRSGVYHSLSIVENLASQPTISEKLAINTALLNWLLARTQAKESPTTQNKQYAAEIISILLQASTNNVRQIIELDAVDLFLQLISGYRRKDPPKDSEEEEYAENLFDSLVCLTDEKVGKQKFVEAEGVELCLIMLREGKFSKWRALRLLDHAVGGIPSPKVSEKFVEAAGLKTLFSMFMKQLDASSTEHVLGIFSSLLAQLEGDSAPRIRTLAKFVEKDYEKVKRLMDIRRGSADRLRPVNRGIAIEKSELDADDQEERAAEWRSRQLDAGLYSFQTANVILAWLIGEDVGARKIITALLQEQGGSIADIKATLEEQLEDLQGAEHEAGASTAEILKTLIDIL